MKKNLQRFLVASAAMMTCVSSFAIDKVVKSAQLTGKIETVEQLDEAASFLLATQDNQVLYIPSGWDIKAGNLVTAIAGEEYLYKVVKPEGKEERMLQVLKPSLEAMSIGWLTATEPYGTTCFVNCQPAGNNTVFGLGLNNRFGQDGENLALWTITATESGLAFKNAGRENTWLTAVNGAAAPAAEETSLNAYAGYEAGWNKATLESTYAEVLAEVKTTDTKAALEAATTDDLDAYANAVNAAIDVINECNAIVSAYAAVENAEAREVVSKYNAGEYKNATELRDAFIAAAKLQNFAGANMTLAIINPSFETGTLEGWTTTDGGDIAKNMNFGANIAGQKFVERWTPSGGTLSNGTLLQTLTGMPNGTYKLSANMQNLEQGNNDANGKGFFLVLNDSVAECAAVGKVEVIGTVANDTLTIGAKLDGCTGNWMCIDNFELTLVEPAVAPVDTIAPVEPTPGEEIVGTQVKISAGGSCTIPLPEDAVRVVSFQGQWGSITPTPNSFDATIYKDIQIDFKDALEYYFNTPYKDAEGTQKWGGVAQGSTSFTLDFSTVGSITDLFIQNTQANETTPAPSFAITKAVATKLDGTTENITFTAGWNANISIENCDLYNGAASFASQWASLNIDAENILNVTDKNVVLRIYANEPIPSTVQWCVKYADDDSNGYPQVGISADNGNYAEVTIERPISSIFLQWTGSEAGTIDIKAITYEIKDKAEVEPEPNAADTLANATVATVASIENIFTEPTTIVIGDDSTTIELTSEAVISVLKGEEVIGTATGEAINVEGNKITVNFTAVQTEAASARALAEEAEVSYSIAIKAADIKINGVNPTKDLFFGLAKAEEPEPAKPEIAKLEAGDYFFYNEEAKAWLGGANSWGTQASVVAHPQRFTIAVNEDGTYTLDSHTYNNASNHFLGSGLYVDAAASNWTINVVEGGFALTAEEGKYLATATESTVLTTVEDINAAAAAWKIYSETEMIKALEEGTTTDATFALKGASISRNLYSSKFDNVWEGDAFSMGGDNTNQNAEKWGGNSQTFNVHQTITVPNGKYTLKFQGFYRYNNTTENTNDVAAAAHADSTEVINSFVYANNDSVALMSIADTTAVNAYGKMPFSQAEASAAFNMGLYASELNFEVKDSTLTIGVKKIEHLGCDWTIWDNFELIRIGDLDPEPEPVDTNLIAIELGTAEAKVGDFVNPANKEEKDGYTTYTTNGNICVIFKMLNVDVTGCDYILFKFANPTPSELQYAFWNHDNKTAELPEGITEFKYTWSEDEDCRVVDGKIAEITLLTMWKENKTVDLIGVYKHKIAQSEEEADAIKSVEVEDAASVKKMLVNGKLVIVKGGKTYNVAGSLIK